MTTTASIDIAMLREITNQLLERLEANYGPAVELSSDYYWDIPEKLRYDKYDEPHEFVVGQLSEDLTFVEEMVSGARPPVTYGLVWIASLLRYVGEKIVD